MLTIFDSARVVKSRRSFGVLPARERRRPYTQADLDWAAQAYARADDGFEPDWNRLAAQRAWEASYEACYRVF